jgi:hypothetical protein
MVLLHPTYSSANISVQNQRYTPSCLRTCKIPEPIISRALIHPVPYAVAAMSGEGLRPELRALFERLATAPGCDATPRSDGMIQSGPDPASAKSTLSQTPARRKSNAGSAAALSTGAAYGQNQQAEINNDT